MMGSKGYHGLLGGCHGGSWDDWYTDIVDIRVIGISWVIMGYQGVVRGTLQEDHGMTSTLEGYQDSHGGYHKLI